MIALRDVVVTAGSFRLEVEELELREGEYVVVFGPTGSGKTMLLETIAGLRALKQGSVGLGPRDVTSDPPEARRIGFVQQGSLLFPHLSVADNIAFGLRARTPRAGIASRVAELAELVGAQNLLARWPGDLSGGEQQRVALARAFAVDPIAVLLDEPFGALDAPSREAMLLDMRRALAVLGPAVMHVTHDLDEAIGLADRIVVLDAGSIKQVGSPDEVLRRPASAIVARLMGARNVFSGSAIQGEVLLDSGQRLRSSGATRGRTTAVVRPEDVDLTLVGDGLTAVNVLRGTIVTMEHRASDVLVGVDVGTMLDVRLTRRDHRGQGLAVGDEVWASFDADDVHLCSAD